MEKEKTNIVLSPVSRKALAFIGRKVAILVIKTKVTESDRGYSLCLNSLNKKIKTEPAMTAQRLRAICLKREKDLREIIDDKPNREKRLLPWQLGTQNALNDMLEHLA